MGLPIPNLDDKSFDALVEEARLLISRFAPQWTDHNLHDPGITFIELFAWLAEMQIYQLNRVTDAVKRKFLKLIDFYPSASRPAGVNITFPTVPDLIALPAGTPLFTKQGDEEIVFKIQQDFILIQADITRVVTSAGSKIVDHTEANKKEDIHFAPFGEKAPEGATLLLALSNHFPADKEIPVTFDIYEDDLQPVGSFGGQPERVIPSVQVLWEYQHQGSWELFNIKKDHTLGLSRSGSVVLTGPPSMEPNREDGLYWIRCRLEKGQYEIIPKVSRVLINTISALQVETVINEALEPGLGIPDQKVQLNKERLLCQGRPEIQIQQEKGDWVDWVEMDEKDQLAWVHSRLKEGRYEIIPSIERIWTDTPLAVQIEMLKKTYLGSGDNISDQVPDIQCPKSPLIRERQACLNLQIRGAKCQWERWKEMDDFALCGPDDPCYTLDSETGEITFGNGLNGRIPEESQEIRAVLYQTTQGTAGNIPAGSEFRIKKEALKNIKGNNLQRATGGRNAETIEAAIARARKDFKTSYRAITLEDYEKLAISTPGLRVAKAKAISNYHPRYPAINFPGSVTLVAVPAIRPGRLSPPVAGEGFLQTILNHLNAHRLITTDLYVIGPEYVKISVQCSVHLKKGNSGTAVKEQVTQALDNFLNPLQGGPEGKGWDIGRAVFPSEIYQLVDTQEGVNYVTGVTIDAEGPYRKDKDGETIAIPSNGLVFSGDHRLEMR